MTGCNEICLQYYVHKCEGYASGIKRCQRCTIYMRYEGSSCPCCGYRLRNGPRYGKSEKPRY